MNQKSSVKRKILTLFLLLLTMIFIPLLSVRGKKEFTPLKPVAERKIEKRKNFESKFFKALDESTNKIVNIPDKEFLCGVVASEMPARFEKEALKAQAVASYTYFSRERAKSRESKNSNKTYDFKINTAKSQNYTTKKQMELKWGKNFEKYYRKIKDCVDEVFPEVLESNGDLILAAYHAISSGKTEKCEDVFGGNLNYLTNVESTSDKLVEGYETKLELTKDEFKNTISNHFKDCLFEENPAEWIKTPIRTEGGMVKEINICSKTLEGPKVRSIFGLRSSDFDINYASEKEKFIFTVRGYGHGVGMSQHGAQHMAKQGASYKEILSWYYPHTSINKLSK